MAAKRFRKSSRFPKAPVVATGEHYEQTKFFSLISQINHPAVENTYAIPNQAVGGHKQKQLYYWREGMRAGVLDVCIAYPSKGFHGAYIEFKFGDNKPTEAQYRWLYRLQKAGYSCAVCYSGNAGFEFFLDYLGITHA